MNIVFYIKKDNVNLSITVDRIWKKNLNHFEYLPMLFIY